MEREVRQGKASSLQGHASTRPFVGKYCFVSYGILAGRPWGKEQRGEVRKAAVFSFVICTLRSSRTTAAKTPLMGKPDAKGLWIQPLG